MELRVTYDRKPYYINTGIKCLGRELQDGHFINRGDANVLQQRLDIIVNKLLGAVNRCIDQGLEINVAEIRRQAYSVDAVADSSRSAMLDWMEQQVPLLPIKDSTRSRYKVLIHRLREFGGLTAWGDLTVERLYQFDNWLHGLRRPASKGDIQAGREPDLIGDAAIYNYHRTLRSLIVRAVKFEKIKHNPYERIRGAFRKGIKENVEYLTEDEVAAIESLHPIPGTQVAMARDLFIFQLYTGLSYADAQAFDINHYKMDNGRWVYTGQRIKTGVPYVSQLLPPAVEVLERYGWGVPKIENSHYNEALKSIQKGLGLHTRLHSHLARHTFATRALRLGVKIENVSKMLGHTNVSQTQRYAKVLAEAVHEDFDKMREKLTKQDKETEGD